MAEIIASNSDLKIGFGIVSPLRRSCAEIIKKLDELNEKFGDRFIAGIAPGKYDDARRAFEKTLECIRQIKLSYTTFVGCSSPKITALSSEIADGILFNYVKPEYLKWIMRHARKKLYFAAYGPALILPSDFEEDLLIASAIVSLSSRRFVTEFGFSKMAEKLWQLSFDELVNIRMRGESISRHEQSEILFRYKNTLLDNFTISGSFDEVATKTKSILAFLDHVIFSDPFFRDMNSLRQLKRLVKVCETL